MNESGRPENYYMDKTSLSNKDLEKELLDSPSINNIYSKETNNSIISMNSEINNINNLINTNIMSHNTKNLNNINSSLINQNNSENNNIENTNKDKRTQSHLSSNKSEESFIKNLLYNIDFEKTVKIEEIINENADKVISVTSDDMNILQRATFLNKISSVKTIIKELKRRYGENNIKLNNFINSKNKRGYTSLHYSIICGNVEIYKILLKNGADRNISTNSGYNNLILACQTRRTYVFLDEIKNQIINKQLDFSLLFNIKDKNNATLLHWAAFSDYVFGVQYLLSLNDINNISNKNININFINFINSKDNNNMTALQYALMNNSNKAVYELVLLKNIDLDNKDVDNRNCFDYADSMANDKFKEILKIRNSKYNIFIRFIKVVLLIIYNILVYFITLPIINKFYILVIQLGLNFLIIIDALIIKCVIKPGYEKGNSTMYKSMIFNINENNIYRELTEIARYCPYCYFKKEKTTTKHCPICNICVENFIKHDIFFNICIGTKNYFFYALFKILFLIYLLFFIIISFWSIFINLNNNSSDIIFPYIKINLFYCEQAISIISFGTIFIFIWILFLIFWGLYKECRLKNNINISRNSVGLNKIGTNNSRNESIM